MLEAFFNLREIWILELIYTVRLTLWFYGFWVQIIPAKSFESKMMFKEYILLIKSHSMSPYLKYKEDRDVRGMLLLGVKLFRFHQFARVKIPFHY